MLSAIILLLIFLPVTIALLLAIPSIQNMAIDRASSWASEKLGTKVSVGNITYGLLNRVAVRDFYVEDLDGDTLLYVNKVSAYLSGFTIKPTTLTFNYGRVDGGKFILRETERGEINVKEVTDRIPRPEEKKPFRLDIRSIDGKGIDFRLHRLAEHNPAGVDYANMQMLDIETHINDFAVINEAVKGDITTLSFVELSGFVLDNLSGSFRVDRGEVEVTDAVIKSNSTNINLKHLLLDGDKDWLRYQDFINNVCITCEVENSRISSDDVGYFAPEIWGWQTSVNNATLSMNGTVANFIGKVKHAELEDGGTLIGTARVRGLIDVPRTRFNINVQKLDASTNEILRLLGNIAHLSVDEKASAYIERAEHISASGSFNGTINDFKAKIGADIKSGGHLAIGCAMQSEKSGKRSVQANISSSDTDLAKLLGNKIFGATSFIANANISIGGEEPLLLTGSAEVSKLGLNGHDYNNLSLIADIEGPRIAGSMKSNDSALKMEAQAILDKSDTEQPICDAVVSIEHADLHAMNINRRDSISVLRCEVGMSANGATLDDMDGVLRIADAEYTTMGRSCDADLVELSIVRNEDNRTVTLSSDFADAIFDSRTSYKDVIYYLKNILAQYTPLLYDNSSREAIDRGIEKIGDEVAILSVTTKDIDPLLDCITNGLEMAEGSKLEMLISPIENRFVMRASSEYLMHHNYLATNIDIKAGNAGDSLALSMHAEDLYAGIAHFSGVGVKGGAKDNTINIDAQFADSLRNLSGEISAKARISREKAMRKLDITLNPTHIHSGNHSWNITTDGIEIDSTRVAIRNFAMRSNTQELYLNGVASEKLSDSLYLRLNNFSLSPLTQFTKHIGYEIEGKTNGYATVHSAMRDSRIDARIEMDSVDVNGMAVPDLLLSSHWDFGRSRASLDISTRKNNQTIIKGYYAPSQARYYARMQTGGVNMGLLDPVLKGVLSGTEGVADIDLTLTGEQRSAELKGNIEVRDLATTIDYIACRYRVPKASIEVSNNHFKVNKATILDQFDNRGAISMDLSLNHLSNIEYSVDLQIGNMQVMNTTENDNPMFYGSIFATGTGSIRGDKAGVKMDFAARSDNNSKFYMPLTDHSDIQSADFVTFATKSADTTSYLMRKKMLFESRQMRRTTGESAMDITMALEVRPNAEVQLVIDPTVGDIIKATGEGMLNMRINPQANILEMYGDYTIEKGSYLFTLQNIINKWFDIEPGSTIQWTGEPLNAMLNIDAVYRLKASLQPLLQGSLTESSHSSRAVPVECFIHLTDRLTQPNVTFDIVVPNVDADMQNVIASTLATPESKSQQFLYLLLSNSFMSESSSTSASASVTSAAAATGFEMLSNQLSNWLANDGDRIVLRYRPRTEQMSEEVDFGFSKGLINNRLLIEVEGNYIVDKTQVVNATSNFTGEAYVTWLIDRAGTLRLKGFTHTIDRFDENQGLQETGVGIYFKEDFDNGRDLRNRLKHRFKREKDGGQRRSKESKAVGEKITIDGDTKKSNNPKIEKKTDKKSNKN